MAVVSFMDLPMEMRLNLFSYLTVEELCETVLPVFANDEETEQLVYDALIQSEEVTLYKEWMNHVSLAKYGRVLQRKRAVITRVNVYPLLKTQLPILNDLPSLPRLTTLIMKCYFFQYPLYSMISQCIHLQELWLHVIPYDSLIMFAHLLSSLPHLTRLSVHIWGGYHEADLYLHAIANQPPPLQRLHIKTNMMRDCHLESILLRHSVSLTHFKLNNRLFTNQAIQMISQCANLESLSIDDCDRIDTLSPLKSLSKLTSLHLCLQSQIPLHELESLFLFLPQLTYLKLEHIALSDQMFINLAKHSPKLKTLIVIHCCHGVTNPIIASLLTCRQLQHVILDTNHRITSQWIQKLEESPLSILKVKNSSLCRGNILSSVLNTWFDDSVEHNRTR